MTRNPGRLVSVSTARHSRVYSSMIVSTRKVRPCASVSATKSIAQRWFAFVELSLWQRRAAAHCVYVCVFAWPARDLDIIGKSRLWLMFRPSLRSSAVNRPIPEALPLPGQFRQPLGKASSALLGSFLPCVERANCVNLQARRSLIPCCCIATVTAARLPAGSRSFFIAGLSARRCRVSDRRPRVSAWRSLLPNASASVRH